MSDESGRLDRQSTGTLPPTTPDAAPGRGGRFGDRLPGFWGLIRLVALLVVLAIAAGVISFVVGWRPSFMHNPFKHQTIDRSEPAVLRSLETINDYHAASGHFEVVVDTQSSTKYIPSFLSGEQVLFVGVGTVDSVVSFKGLDASRVKVSPDGKSVTINLPPPTLGKPQLDLQKSYVVARQRGALTRIGNFFGGQSSDKNVYIKATQQMTSAASADGQIITLGKTNTEAMLRGLLNALGYQDVTITFDEDKK